MSNFFHSLQLFSITTQEPNTCNLSAPVQTIETKISNLVSPHLPPRTQAPQSLRPTRKCLYHPASLIAMAIPPHRSELWTTPLALLLQVSQA